MRFLGLSTRKDLVRMVRDPVGLVTWITLPVIMTVMMALVFREGDPIPRGKLLFVDHDNTLLSSLLSSAFSREPLSRMITVERMEEAPARERMNAGEASAMLVVPKGFTDDFLRRKATKLQLVKNPSAWIMPEMIDQTVGILVEGGYYLQRMFGSEFDRMANGRPSELVVAAASVRVNRMLREYEQYINPPLVELETRVIVEQKKRPPFAVLFFPGMLMFGLFGLAVSRSEDIWREKALGTLRRAMTTPQSLAAYFGGKVLAIGVVTSGIGALGLALARAGLGAEIVNPALALVWAPCAGMSFFLLNVLIQMAASDQRSGVMLSSLLLFIFGMVGGMFFPFEMMPEWLASVGKFAPNGWMILRFKEMIHGPVAAGAVAGQFGAVAVLNVMAFAFVCRRLRSWGMA